MPLYPLGASDLQSKDQTHQRMVWIVRPIPLLKAFLYCEPLLALLELETRLPQLLVSGCWCLSRPVGPDYLW